MIGATNHAFKRLRQRFGVTLSHKQVSDMVRKGEQIGQDRVRYGDVVFVLRPRNRGKGRERHVVTVLYS